MEAILQLPLSLFSGARTDARSMAEMDSAESFSTILQPSAVASFLLFWLAISGW